jgi:hypothetical protein
MRDSTELHIYRPSVWSMTVDRIPASKPPGRLVFRTVIYNVVLAV